MDGMGRMRFLVAVGVGLGAVASALTSTPVAVAAEVAEAQAPAQPAMTDEAIVTNIKARLDGNKLVRNAQVRVSSIDGEVTVLGTVPTDFARDAVMEAVRATPGVVRVNDQMRLEISSPHAPTRY
jgi:osmotically-inducible protein OsmY